MKNNILDETVTGTATIREDGTALYWTPPEEIGDLVLDPLSGPLEPDAEMFLGIRIADNVIHAGATGPDDTRSAFTRVE